MRISEHFLYPDNVHFLDTLSDYDVHVSCDRDLSLPGPRRVGKGGVCLLWYKRYSNNIVPLGIDDDISVGIQCQTTQAHFLFIFQL